MSKFHSVFDELTRLYEEQESSQDLAIILQRLETDDYQNRHGEYPKSNIPTDIRLDHDREGTELWLIASFKNTSESTAKAWMHSYLGRMSLKPLRIETSQTGDYRDDWVDACAVFLAN